MYTHLLNREEDHDDPHRSATYHSISNLTKEVGANDTLIGVRVVPAGRDGNKVFGRTLAYDEVDSGEAVTVYPREELHFPPGSVQMFLRDIDRESKPEPDGYTAVSNTIWTWLSFGAPPDPTLFRLLFAAVRRLDTAHALYAAEIVEDLQAALDELALIAADLRVK